MTQTKSELELEVAGLLQLAEKVKSLPLEEQERELLEELVLNREARTKQEWRTQRIENAVDLLFPSYSCRQPEEEKPLRWPEKSWWWNGASITACDDQGKEGCVLSLQSYTGRNNYDELDNFKIPNEWIEADDQAAVIHKACQEKDLQLKAEARKQELLNAQQALAFAAKKLEQLKGDTHE